MTLLAQYDFHCPYFIVVFLLKFSFCFFIFIFLFFWLNLYYNLDKLLEVLGLHMNGWTKSQEFLVFDKLCTVFTHSSLIMLLLLMLYWIICVYWWNLSCSRCLWSFVLLSSSLTFPYSICLLSDILGVICTG